MSRSLRRGVLAASALVFSLAPLTACGAGNNAQTLGVKPDSAATSVGDISIQNATVVTQPEANAEGPAVVTGTVFNNGRSGQTLDSITLPGTSAAVKLSPASGSGPITVPAGGWVQLGGEGNASAVIENGREAAKDGDAQQVVFTFSETGDVGLRAFVFPSDTYFKGVGPSALPSPSLSAPVSPSPGASGTPAGSVSGSPADAQSGAAGGPLTTTENTSSPSDSASASTH
ncbi:DUF461 domain-containing protein [Streptomyces sp. MnatMP-M17]|uniref:DUF461 domain-containing protein n=1 Tax=unclassified Streptomyces TaxID=2593676 RepID=UPI00081EE3BC|nr:DUF461 domain-containing protein [Streptomyces sp. MnatMP-M17]MYZ34119.1 DUF461 domain-containing protein [Streptomyces sp. SID4917]SCF64297.1 hypothetical protein GA0115259_100535 [Streptomyces sp. MnatMP-M17]